MLVKVLPESYKKYVECINRLEEEDKRHFEIRDKLRKECVDSLPFKVGSIISYEGREYRVNSIGFEWGITRPNIRVNTKNKNGEWSKSISNLHMRITQIGVIEE